jgi:hypothetical protein
MPKLIKSAHRLYLAEAAALAAPKNLDISVLLAAATHMRHKFAEHALDKMFFAAADTKKNTILRKILVFRLVLCAQAAYQDIEPLFQTPELAAATVKPYYATREYKFGSLYHREPLNLFPGLSTENLKNSNQVVDLHRQNQVQGLVPTHGYPIIQSDPTTPTKSSTIMQIETPNSKAIEDTFSITTNWYGDVTQDYINSCSALDMLLNNDQIIIDRSHYSKIKTILDDLGSMSNVSEQLTKSGIEHYRQLLKNLREREKEFLDRDKKREFETCDKLLTAAGTQWETCRKNLDTSISTLLSQATKVC